MVVDGTEYGEVRQYGNFSFARIYESGHEIPYYQRESPPRFFLNINLVSRSISC
jgi:carboxypeptidase C (cathepsin A)